VTGRWRSFLALAPTPAGPAVSAQGIAVASIQGWDVRIYRRDPRGPETTHAVLHAATFPLPPVRGDYGDGAVDLMGPADVFVALVEFHPSSASTALFAARGFPSPLTADDVSRTSLQRQVGRQAGVQRFFNVGGRAWCLYVVIGDWDGRAWLVPRANQLVAGIEVQASGIGGGG